MSLASQTALDRPPALPKPWTAARIGGVVVLAFWALVLLGLIWWLVDAWNPDLFDKYAPKYLSGLWVTVKLVSLSIVLGALLSIPVAAARMSDNPIFAWPAYAYVYFFRGTPLLAQTFLVYYGLGEFSAQLDAIGLWTWFRDAWVCGLFAFTLNTAAYQAEILKGALESVPKGQWEAAAALGMSKPKTMWKIILPQALIVALRPYGNEIILMIKGSAIVAIITVYDLMGETRRAYARSFDFQTYIWAALIYLSIVEALRHIWDALENRLTRHLKR